MGYLKVERDKEILKKLIMKADIMIENMSPGAIERLGFGYDSVRQLNPRIIYAQIKVFIYTSRAGNKHWQKLLKVIGREDLLNDPRFSSPQARINHVEEVDALLAGWCGQRTKIEAMDML